MRTPKGNKQDLVQAARAQHAILMLGMIPDSELDAPTRAFCKKVRRPIDCAVQTEGLGSN